jgi:hypothetical protein
VRLHPHRLSPSEVVEFFRRLLATFAREDATVPEELLMAFQSHLPFDIRTEEGSHLCILAKAFATEAVKLEIGGTFDAEVLQLTEELC